MKQTGVILISLAWTALFGAVAGFALYAAEGGAALAIATFGLPLEGHAIETMPGKAVMGGLCFGATAVAALFATVALSVALTGREGAAHTRFLAEIAHGGAFGIAGLVVLTLAMSANGLMLGAALGCLALLIASLVWLRAALADPVPEPMAPPVVARQMAVAAAANVNVVRFPYYRAGGAA
jgi:hypothetical protein